MAPGAETAFRTGTIGRFGRLLVSGRFPVHDLLSKPYALAQADQALQDLAAGKVGRPLIDMSLR